MKRVTVWNLVLLGGAFALGASPAAASCLNLCTMHFDPVEVSPPLDCVSIRTAPNDCNCTLLLDVTNQCATTLQATDFEFNSCATDDKLCSEIAPEDDAGIRISLDEVGTKEWSYRFDVDGEAHTLSVVTHVDTQHEEDEGCSLGSVPATAGTSPYWAGGLVAALAWRRTRARTKS